MGVKAPLAMAERLHQDAARYGRVVAAIGHAAGRQLIAQERDEIALVSASDPNGLRRVASAILGGRVQVTGTLENRLLVAERPPLLGGWTLADLSGRPHAERRWPAWTGGRIIVDSPERWLSTGNVTEVGAQRLFQPRVLLCAMYHPEWFPLPRLALAISDLARAARRTLMGTVQLMDMQLGLSLGELIDTVETEAPDVVGISATFGQHDLLITFLDHVYARAKPPLVLAGGSLTVRNQALLQERYPNLLVARGAGEPTMAGVLGYFHGDLGQDKIPGIGAGSVTAGTTSGALQIEMQGLRTATVPNARQEDFLPELDLLDATLAHKGVAQIEASRGCTSACGFCPRSHKGKWAPGTVAHLELILPEIRRTFDQHPEVSRTLYLVDEECIGRDTEAVERILDLAATVHNAGFAWESSCRIDQVVCPGAGREWHLERAQMWRELKRCGLRRMLFGVESGVTSILERFNKETTSDQNALAIRTLSALGIPTRFTYITFDQLMTYDELAATHAFQGRTDLLLTPQPHLSVEEIVDGVRDDAWVAAHATGQPFYTAISYMLVVMECLIGAAYTRMVADRGLTGAVDPSMGRVEARFADARIGACARSGQLWVDRNFALDYTLKSLEKLVDGPEREKVHETRVTIRTAAYRVFTGMLMLIDRLTTANNSEAILEYELQRLLDRELEQLRIELEEPISTALPALEPDTAGVLHSEHRRWIATTEWRLINAADACGT